MCLTETKMADHSELLMEFNYTDLIQVATQGQSEGIVILWRAHELVINTVAITSQEIHTSVKLNKSPSWLLSLVYASNNFTDTKILLNNLQTVHEHFSCAWLLCGDFKEVSTSKEKFGGAPINIKKSSTFNKYLNNIKMIDLGFSGPRYIWTNKPNFNHQKKPSKHYHHEKTG